MIVGSEFGWSAVSDEPMTWDDFQIARQLLAEQRVGRRIRQIEAEEDAAFDAVKAQLSRG